MAAFTTLCVYDCRLENTSRRELSQSVTNLSTCGGTRPLGKVGRDHKIGRARSQK